MTGADLYSEHHEAVFRLRRCHMERLRDLGISYAALAALSAEEPTIAFGRVSTKSDGFFVPDENGQPMVLQAVVALEREWSDPGVIDLLAWRTSDPSRWWWRSGTAFALGWELLHGDHPVPVVPTPAAWLAAAGNAVCLLDWADTSPVWPLLRSAPPLTFTDDALRQRVRNGLVKTAPMPSLELSDAA